MGCRPSVEPMVSGVGRKRARAESVVRMTLLWAAMRTDSAPQESSGSEEYSQARMAKRARDRSLSPRTWACYVEESRQVTTASVSMDLQYMFMDSSHTDVLFGGMLGSL